MSIRHASHDARTFSYNGQYWHLTTHLTYLLGRVAIARTSSKWDIAAGIVLVREAGGFVSDLSGGESFWDTGDIVAANPKCFKSLIQTLRV